jgi:hypothetical protein
MFPGKVKAVRVAIVCESRFYLFTIEFLYPFKFDAEGNVIIHEGSSWQGTAYFLAIKGTGFFCSIGGNDHLVNFVCLHICSIILQQ